MSEIKGQCTRCHRGLKDPQSVARSMGPICWAESGGDIFEADLQADEKEWTRREELLRHGGEVDFGVNWQYPVPDNVLPTAFNLRVSVRYKDGNFEAYGVVYGPGTNYEIVFASSPDIKAIYRAAVEAGPTCTARAHWTKMQAVKKARKMMRIAG